MLKHRLYRLVRLVRLTKVENKLKAANQRLIEVEDKLKAANQQLEAISNRRIAIYSSIFGSVMAYLYLTTGH